jgi:phosphoribosylformylglycinamidine cyclo-ligase
VGEGLSYAAAGVSLEEAERAVAEIAKLAPLTYTEDVVEAVGGFASVVKGPGGMWLAATTDGVGTKSQVAAYLRKYDTIGLDLVAMLVDDLVCTGARPLFLQDYLVQGKLDHEVVRDVVKGLVAGCGYAGCVLSGGELAEHPGAMPEGHFDLAGTCVGVLAPEELIGPRSVAGGEALVGISSPNLRCNGFSLARKIVFDNGLADTEFVDGRTWAEELLKPSVIYCPAVLETRREVGAESLRAAAHVTGGGLLSNLSRSLPEGLEARVDWGAWELPRVFRELARIGRVPEEEMRRTFNMGIGMVLVVARDAAESWVEALRFRGHQAWQIGGVAGRVS